MHGIEKIEPEYNIGRISVILAPTAKSHLDLLKFSLEQSIEGEEEVLIKRFLESFLTEYRRLLKKELDPENLTIYEFSFDKEDLVEFKKNTQELINILEENNNKRQILSYQEYFTELNNILFEADKNIRKMDKSNEDGGKRKAA